MQNEAFVSVEEYRPGTIAKAWKDKLQHRGVWTWDGPGIRAQAQADSRGYKQLTSGDLKKCRLEVD